MSDINSDTTSSTDTYIGIWQGLEAIPNKPVTTTATPVRPSAPLVSNSLRESERVTKALTFPNPSTTKCRVPGCRLRDCRLGTHQRFDPGLTEKNLVRTRKNVRVRAAAALKQRKDFDKDLIYSNGVDGFPTLPLDETLNPNVKSLFHYFFTNTFDKLAILFRGPSVSDMDEFKKRMLATALKSEAYCRSLILQARIEQDSAKHRYEETSDVLALNNNLIQAFRKQLVVIHEKPHPLQIELALLVLCILLLYDGNYGHDQAQKLHWQGMRNLISMRGGMHGVTMALAYVSHADRVCATRLGVPPTYTNPLARSLPMPIPTPSPLRYGSRFHAMIGLSSVVDRDVVDYLIEVSGLVERWEEQQAQAQAKATARQTGSLHCSLDYLHYTRDRLDERFTVLNAQWVQTDTVERCLLWASRIIEYPCTWSNYVEALPKDLCRKLAEVLQQQQEPMRLCQSDLNLLAWMVFSLAISETGPVIHRWVIAYLREILSARYDWGTWPATWWVDEQDNLSNYVWSSSHYHERCKSVCDELERHPRVSPPVPDAIPSTEKQAEQSWSSTTLVQSIEVRHWMYKLPDP